MKRRLNDDEKEEAAEDEEIKQRRNKVFFYGEVNRKNVSLLVEKLESACDHILLNSGTHIELFIHSEGGDAYAGLSAMNHIQTCRVPVHCVADGIVASAATFLLLGGTKRLAMQHASVLIHQLSTGFWGKFVDLQDELKNSEQLMNIFYDIYSTQTTMKSKKINSILKKELTMTTAECLKNGIVEAIYSPQLPVRL